MSAMKATMAPNNSIPATDLVYFVMSVLLILATLSKESLVVAVCAVSCLTNESFTNTQNSMALSVNITLTTEMNLHGVSEID